MENAKVIDTRYYNGSLDLQIQLASSQTTTLKNRDLSKEKDAMNQVRKFNKNMNRDSRAR